LAQVRNLRKQISDALRPLKLRGSTPGLGFRDGAGREISDLGFPSIEGGVLLDSTYD
jgi:hypothetical protein